MSEQNSVVAIFGTHTGAEEAVKELQRGGIDIHSLSIVGKDCHTDQNVVGGLSAVGAGLFSIGIPKYSVLKYETALKTGKFLLMVHGPVEDVEKAREILENSQPESVISHLAEALVA